MTRALRRSADGRLKTRRLWPKILTLPGLLMLAAMGCGGAQAQSASGAPAAARPGARTTSPTGGATLSTVPAPSPSPEQAKALDALRNALGGSATQGGAPDTRKPSDTAPRIPSPPGSAQVPRAPAAEATNAGNEIRFGLLAPFSGTSRDLGRNMRTGLDIAFAQANKSGGINGRTLKLLTADDGYEPTKTPEAFAKLADDVFAFVGNVGTPTVAAVLPSLLQRKTLLFAPFTGAGVVRKDPPDRYVFNFRPSYAEETETTVRYLTRVRRLRPDQIAVFAQDDGFGDSGYSGVEKALRKLQADQNAPPLRLRYKRNTVEVEAAIAQLRARKGAIRAVVMVATYRPAARFIEKTRDLYPDMIFTNVSFVGSTSLADELLLLDAKTGRYAAGVIVTQVVPAVDSHATAILNYREALAEFAAGEKPDYVSLEGYISAKLLIEGLRAMGPTVNTEKLVDGLESLGRIDLGLGNVMGFSQSEHQASHKIWGTVLDKSGRFQPLDLD